MTVTTIKAATKINRAKEEAVQDIRHCVEIADDIIFTDFRGLNVEQITKLRNKLRERESIYRVVKNNYARLAIAQLKLPDASEYLLGPTALALVKGDSGPVAKIILNFGREATVKLKGGIIQGKIFSAQDLQSLSRLPGRDQLVAMLMSTMNAPLQEFSFTLNGITQKLVRTLKAIADSKEK